MDEKTRKELALFRFSLIASLVNGTTDKTMTAYFGEICAKRYDVPGFGNQEFAPVIVKKWLTNYLRHGLEGLKKDPRSDKGCFRKLTAEAQQFIKEAKKYSLSESWCRRIVAETDAD